MWRRAFLIVLLFCATALGCQPSTVLLPPGFAEPEDAHHVLTAGQDPGEWVAKPEPANAGAPVTVVQATPKTMVQGTAAITVVFDRPMVALGAVPDGSDPRGFPIVVAPAVEAVYRWVAGDTLKVALEKPLKNAHVYAVTVPRGTRALDGRQLAGDYRWTFETPRPRLLRASPWPAKVDRADRLLPSDALQLTFNLQVDPSQVKRALRLTAGGAEQAVEVRRHKGDPKRVLVTPIQPLPMAASVRLEIAKGLRSTEGPIGSKDAKTSGFATPGPLTARGWCSGGPLSDEPECWPMVEHRTGDQLEIELSEPVYRQDLLRALRLSPTPAKPLAGVHGVRRWCHGDDKRGPCSRKWRFHEDLLPRRKHRIQLAPGLEDIYGQKLAKPYAAEFRTSSYPPGLFLAHDQRTHREQGQDYVIKAVNVSEIEIKLRAYRGAELVRFSECIQNKKKRDQSHCPKGVETRQRLPVKARRDQIVSVPVQLPAGLVVMEISSPQIVDDVDKRVLFHRRALQSDAGLHARLTPFGLVAWVTSLERGTATKGTEVLVFDSTGKQLHRGETDASGLLEVPRSAFGNRLAGDEAPKLYVLARDGKREAFLELSESDSDHYWQPRDDDPYLLERRELSERSSWDGDKPVTVGAVSTERGIYRPGQPVYVQGAVRIYRTWKPAPAAGQQATVSIQADDHVLAKKKVKLSSFGAFRLSLPLPAKGRLGGHLVRLEVNGETLAERRFRVGEYREPRFRVQADATPHEQLAGGKLTLAADARYLFGGAMAGAGYRMSVGSYYTMNSIGDHRVGCSSLHSDEAKGWARRAGTLGSDGKMREVIDLGTVPLDKPCPMVHSVEVEVRSADRQTSAGRARASQWPGELIGALEHVPAKDTALGRKLFVLRWDTKKPVAARATVTLHPRDQDEIHWSRVSFRKELVVAPQGTLLQVPWPEGLESRVGMLVISVRDAHGREAWTTERVYRPTDWSHERDKRKADRERREQQLEITLDKKQYLPGDTALVTVTRRGPAGPAMLFVERERIFHSWPLQFDRAGKAQQRVKVTEAFARQVTLRAVMSRKGRALRGRDGPLAAAHETLRISTQPYRLVAEVTTDRKAYRPGDEVEVGVLVRDGLGRPRKAQVVLMAVDEAVLRLTRFILPTPFYALLHTPLGSVLADDVRRHLAALLIPIAHIDHTSPAGTVGQGFGSGTGEGFGSGHGRLGQSSSTSKPKRSRKNFLTTAWHSTVVTDEQGKATASFQLPDNVTEYRLMAWVVDAERSAGTGSTSFRVELPLLALPALPRLARVGDRFEAGVVLYNSEMPAGAATVTAEVDGKTISLVGSEHKSVTLGKGEEREVKFGFQAHGPGASRLTFEVTMGSLTDRIEQPLVVRDAVLMEASSVSGQTRGSVRQGVAPLRALRPDRGGMEISLSSTALSGVEDGMEQLIGYPYGCLEQKSSKLLGLIGATALSDRFGLEIAAEAQAPIQPALDEILAMQRDDGGFGYWPGSRYSSVWGTAYALIVLKRAAQSKAATKAVVPPQAVKRAVDFLATYQGNWGSYSFSYEVAIRYALALHGKDVSSEALALVRRRAHQPLFARAMLLSALKLQRQTPPIAKAVAQLTVEITDSLRIDGTWAHAEENLHDGYKVLMHSDDRTTAMVLMALTPSAKQHPMVPRLVRWFLLGRKQARYRNTQEAAWALLALWDYAVRWEKEVPDFEAGVWLGQRRIVSAMFKGRQAKTQQTRLPMKRLMTTAGSKPTDLVIGKKGSGTLYYVARLRYARKKLPDKARDHGFAVARRIEVLDAAGEVLKTQRAPKLGDTLLVTVTAAAPEGRRYVVVEDPIPAGWEVLDATLATSSQSFGASATRASFYDHREIRDDRVLFFRDHMQPGKLTYRYLARITTAGTFLLPPTKVEEMYTPEVFGHNAATKVHYPQPTAP